MDRSPHAGINTGDRSLLVTRGLNECLTSPPFYLAILIYGSGFAPTSIDVRFTPKSGHYRSANKCPLCAKSRHSARF